MPTVIDGSAGVGFPGGGTQASAAIGEGQTWQDVTASRALGTTYTNTTGRPIMVAVTGSANTSGGMGIIAVVAGVSVLNSRVAGNGYYPSVSFIVPAGATYSVSMEQGSGGLNFWSELR